MLINLPLLTDAAVGKTLSAVPAKAHVATIAAGSFQNGKRFSARETKIVPRHPSAMGIKLYVQFLRLKRTTSLNAMKELRCVWTSIGPEIGDLQWSGGN